MLRRLYDWVMRLAQHRHAIPAMGVVSFAESSFFPIPPDVMLIPMVLANVWQAWRDGQAGMLRRFWPFLLTMLPGTWVGTNLLFAVDPKLLVIERTRERYLEVFTRLTGRTLD